MTNKDWMFPIDAHKSDQEVADLRASLGAHHMQPVDDTCGDVHEQERCTLSIGHVGFHYDESQKLNLFGWPPKPPAPREISDAEAEAFCEEALLDADSINIYEAPDRWSESHLMLARHAIRQIESARAPQTAPHDPYVKGQWLP